MAQFIKVTERYGCGRKKSREIVVNTQFITSFVDLAKWDREWCSHLGLEKLTELQTTSGTISVEATEEEIMNLING